MKKIIKSITLILCAIFLISIPYINISASAAIYGEIFYNDDILGGLEIIGCPDDFTGSLTIPMEINGEIVTSIDSNAFSHKQNVTEIILPSSIEIIYRNAFQGSGIENIFFSEGLKTISNEAFLECENLQSVALPDTLTEIGRYAFAYCTSLSTVTLISPDNQTMDTITFEDYVFSGCTNLEEVTLPWGITTLNATFLGCSNLKKVFIPDSVTELQYRAFDECDSLTDIYYAGTEEQWQNIYIYNPDIIEDVTIHYNAVKINDGDISKDSEESAYNKGKEITVKENKVASVKLFTYEIKENDDIEGESDIAYITGLNNDISGELVIPSKIKGAKVAVISERAFENCNGLTKIILPRYVNLIDDSAFEGCDSLTEVIMPDTIIYMGDNAFKDCVKLEKISSYTGSYVFDDEPYWGGNEVFKGCDFLKSIEIPARLSEIDDDILEGCINLETVVLPYSVESIRSKAFYDLKNLKAVYFEGSQLKETGEDIFPETVTVYYDEGLAEYWDDKSILENYNTAAFDSESRYAPEVYDKTSPVVYVAISIVVVIAVAAVIFVPKKKKH